MNNENWIKSTNPPKPNTQCKAKTPAGTDEVGQLGMTVKNGGNGNKAQE